MARTVAQLWTPDVERSDPGLDTALRPVTASDNALAAVRKELFCLLCDKGVSLGSQHSCKHPARTVPSDLG